MAPELALQSYTVRADLLNDFTGTLARVADIGYRHIELHTLADLEPRAVRDLCDRHGLKVISEMATLADLSASPMTYVEHARALGNRHVVCPFIVEADRNADGYRRVAGQLNAINRVLSENGITLCYHNHAFEFDPLSGGATGFDILRDLSFSKGVGIELDVYWVAVAGHDPLVLMNDLSASIPLLHLKDMAADGQRGFAEVGAGTLPLQQVVNQARANGVHYVIVEQDAHWKHSPMQSAADSFRAASAMLQHQR